MLGCNFAINHRLVRGLDYYNDVVFEWTTTRLGAQGTVCAGGRYDGLIEQVGGKAGAGLRFCHGRGTIAGLAGRTGSERRQPGRPMCIWCMSGELAGPFAWSVAEALRDQGLSVVMHCGGGSFKSQMKRADASGARFAVIIGDNEAAEGKLSLKPLRMPGEQVRISASKAANDHSLQHGFLNHQLWDCD